MACPTTAAKMEELLALSQATPELYTCFWIGGHRNWLDPSAWYWFDGGVSFPPSPDPHESYSNWMVGGETCGLRT